MTDVRHTITVMIESDAAEAAGLDADLLDRLLTFALDAEDVPPSSVTLLITDDPGIQELHLEYMDDDTPTDVLSFAAETYEPFPIDPGAGAYLGDIAISWDTAAEQGPEAGLIPTREVSFLALHGLLHLLGMDDATPEERAAMHARQHELLDAFERAVTA
jgi:probable rRNA maturation factor